MTTITRAHGIAYVRTSHPRFRYKLAETYEHAAPIAIRPPTDVDHPFMSLTTAGMLTVQSDYAWDGASGPVADSPAIMRASLLHDVLYQMIREGLVPRHFDRTRKQADALFREIAIEDGVARAKAWFLYYGLRAVGAVATVRFWY